MAQGDRLDRLPVFIEAAANYGKLDKVWDVIPADKQDAVIDLMIEKASKNDFKYAVTLSETISSLQHKEPMDKKTKALLAKFEDKIALQYQRSTGDEHDRLGLVISYYAANGNTALIQDKNRASFIGIRHNQRYDMPATKKLEATRLFDAEKKSYHSYTFYNDSDGRGSFESLMNTYGFKQEKGHYVQSDKSGAWQIDDEGSFVRIHAKGKDGKEIIMYANKPESEGNGTKAMNEAAAAAQFLPEGTEPRYHVVVHRGHSTHARATVQAIGSETAFVYMGSCGGYGEINNVLERAHSAQVLATRGTGTMLVNDPLLKAINERLRAGEDLDWEKIWNQDVSKISSAKKDDYIRPDKNAAAAMIKKYQELKADGGHGAQNIEHKQGGEFAHGGAHLPQNQGAARQV